MNRSIALASSLLMLLASSACKSTRCHQPDCSPSGIAGTTADRFTSAWMTDGSLATFTDTVPIKGLLAEKKLGFKDDFECIPDHRVGIGRLAVPADPSGYEGEAEWAIRFPKPISSYQHITPKALAEENLELVGLIEGKALSRLGDPNDTSWASGCVGNNVITPGRGHATKLSELQCLSERPGRLWLEESFFHSDTKPVALPKGRTFWRRVDIADKDVQEKVLSTPIFHGLVTALAKASANPQAPPALRSACLLNLSALGRESAAVNNSSYQMSGFLNAAGKFLFNCCCKEHGGDLFRDFTRQGTVAKLVSAKDCLPPAGGIIKLTFHHPKGKDEAVLQVGSPR